MYDLDRYIDMCKFTLTDTERKSIEAQADHLNASFSTLDDIDTNGAEPLVNVLTDVRNVLRKDVPNKTIPREVLLAAAPDAQNGYFVVPKTVEG